MNRKYSLDDVESLRSKGNVSYEEAVRLLDKYDGDVANALVELEKRGVLKVEVNTGKAGTVVKDMWNRGMNNYLVITHKDRTVIDLQVLLALVFSIIAPHVLMCAVVLVLLCGCSVSIRSEKYPVDDQAEEANVFDLGEEPAEEEPKKEQAEEDYNTIIVE